MTVYRFPTWRGYDADFLRSLPTLSKGQSDDLKIDTGITRVWLARTGIIDGEEYNDRVSVELLRDGCWTHFESYAG